MDAIEEASAAGRSAVDEDLEFHRAIAEATGNPEFPRFLQFIGRHLIPRRTVSGLPERMGGERAYLALIQEEHRRIYQAIEGARRQGRARGDAPPPHALARALPQARRRTEKSRLKILLTHSPEAMANYYGERALAGLRAVGDVKLHQETDSLEGEALIAAGGRTAT